MGKGMIWSAYLEPEMYWHISLPSTVTMPISTLRGSGRRLLSDANGAIMPYGSAWTLHIAGIGITREISKQMAVIVDDHMAALTRNVGYVILIIPGEKHRSTCISARCIHRTVIPAPDNDRDWIYNSICYHANGIGPWTFFMDNASMGPSSMNTTSPPISASTTAFSLHGRSRTYDAIYRDPFRFSHTQVYAGPIDGVAVQIGTDGMVPETIDIWSHRHWFHMKIWSVGISMFHKDEILAACYRLTLHDGMKSGPIVRGQWDGESIVFVRWNTSSILG